MLVSANRRSFNLTQILIHDFKFNGFCLCHIYNLALSTRGQAKAYGTSLKLQVLHPNSQGIFPSLKFILFKCCLGPKRHLKKRRIHLTLAQYTTHSPLTFPDIDTLLALYSVPLSQPYSIVKQCTIVVDFCAQVARFGQWPTNIEIRA